MVGSHLKKEVCIATEHYLNGIKIQIIKNMVVNSYRYLKFPKMRTLLKS